MFGALPLILLGTRNIMCHSLMIIVNSCRLLCHKSDVFHYFLELQALVE
jgi:hypothetical protein